MLLDFFDLTIKTCGLLICRLFQYWWIIVKRFTNIIIYSQRDELFYKLTTYSYTLLNCMNLYRRDLWDAFWYEFENIYELLWRFIPFHNGRIVEGGGSIFSWTTTTQHPPAIPAGSSIHLLCCSSARLLKPITWCSRHGWAWLSVISAVIGRRWRDSLIRSTETCFDIKRLHPTRQQIYSGLYRVLVAAKFGDRNYSEEFS